MQPRLQKKSVKAPARGPSERKPLRGSQKPATPSRDQVQQVAPQVRAPRQSLRPVERTSRKK
jgi:hypothetical protein